MNLHVQQTPKSSPKGGPSVVHVVVVPTQQKWIHIRRLCVQAVESVLHVMRLAFISGPPAWLLTYFFTLGNLFTGKPPAVQSDADLICMTVFVATFCHCSTVLAPYSLSLQKFTRLDGTPWTFLQLALKFISRTWLFCILTFVLAVGGTYVIVSTEHDFAAEVKLHLYLACIWTALYRASVDEVSRSVYQRETMEGRDRAQVNSSPYWRRYLRAVGRATNLALIAMISAALAHVCNSLDLLNSSFSSLQFSIGSVVLKSIVLKLTKFVAMKQGGTHLRKIYVMTVVPTVLINTQIRLVLLRSIKSGSSVKCFLELGMIEPIARIVKVYHLRYTMKRLKRKQARTRKPTLLKPHARRIRAILPLISASGPQRPSQLIRQETIFGVRQSLLHFHAAASHAEMCSEYIAIICSTSIFYFLQHHPRFGWHEQDGEGLTEWEETLITGSWQIGIEMVVDFTCCVVELANGIPLQASGSLGGVLAAVFTTCALVAVSISTILCAHEAGSTHM